MCSDFFKISRICAFQVRLILFLKTVLKLLAGRQQACGALLRLQQNYAGRSAHELNDSIDFKLWFSGHYHLSMPFDDKHFLIYDDIVKLTDTGFERIIPEY